MVGLPALCLLLFCISSGQSKVLDIIGNLNDPYLMLVNGTDEVTGFIPDLLDAISEVEPFSYRIMHEGYGGYGYKNMDTQEWSGMVGMLTGKDVDVVAADLSITPDRMEAIDFSIPFIPTAVTILLKSQGLRWAMDRSYTDGSLSLTPKYAAQPTTIAQLLNNLWGNRGKDANTKFICVDGGSTHQMLQQSELWEHKFIFSKLHQTVNNYAEGMELVKNEPGIGLVMEKISAEYFASKDDSCRLYTVGKLDYKNYALAFQKGSTLVEMFSRGIVKIQTNGKMFSLMSKWFPENQNCVNSRISLAGGD